jgi:hypothetical protein
MYCSSSLMTPRQHRRPQIEQTDLLGADRTGGLRRQFGETCRDIDDERHQGLSSGEGDGILAHLIRGGDLSQWGLCSAIARMSQDIEDYDRATELERIGGKLIELPKND